VGKPTGFLEIMRQKAPARPVAERVQDWHEVELRASVQHLRDQGARCMDCGIPFCHQGCPLGNLIPDWNDLVFRDKWRSALDRLHATNNFPEFTGRLCPAPCEASCVLGINDAPVTIKSIEVAIAERGFDEGWIVPRPPAVRTNKGVAVIGSGPAGLACADLLNQAGHRVTVFEKASRPGGLLRFGIPEFKMEKRHLDRRLALLEAEGITFRASTNVGVDLRADELLRSFDAVVLAGGAEAPRDLPIPGRDLSGIHFAMEYLTHQNECCAKGLPTDPRLDAKDRRVVIIGGGDTGADCLGTALRQGARTVHQFELLPRPPDERASDNPWPLWPNIFRVSGAHEEGGERMYSVMTERFTSGTSGRVEQLHGVTVDTRRVDGRFEMTRLEGTEFVLDADMVLLAMGFVGAERNPLLTELGIRITDRGTVWRDAAWMTSVPGVFATGDLQRGQSLIVWAIADGRAAARGVDEYLTGSSSRPSC
jgi:glutamate synthase (NADPH/NADH) small chain